MKEHRLLAVFAHPDDEAYRPGGTLALLARRGAARRARVGRKHAGGLAPFSVSLCPSSPDFLIFTVPSVTQA